MTSLAKIMCQNHDGRPSHSQCPGWLPICAECKREIEVLDDGTKEGQAKMLDAMKAAWEKMEGSNEPLLCVRR